jgi:SAM-dependent methyltransferase
MICDFMTEGQKLFNSYQYHCHNGLWESCVIFNNKISLFNKLSIGQIIDNTNFDPTWDHSLKVVVTVNDANNKELFRFSEEYIFIPKEFRLDAISLANNQFSGNYHALLSFERFYIFATNKNPATYQGKKILLSGCGTGAEALVCLEMGASKVVGYDIDKEAIQFAQKRFKDIDRIKFAEVIPDDEDFDLIISRHVVEHIDQRDWKKYFEGLGKLLKKGGNILIDVPNQLNPREPHTELLFFHLLSEDTRYKIYEYCEITRPDWYPPLKDKIRALLDHQNILFDEMLKHVPTNFQVEHYDFIDNNSSDYNGKLADNLRLFIKKTDENMSNV